MSPQPETPLKTERERIKSTTASPIFLPYSVLPVVPLAEPNRKTANSEPGNSS